jgi:two-component system NtrC family sensor kinase
MPLKVLLADDDRVFQVMLRRTLSRWGYEPVIASDGEEAWKQLSTPGGPSLAILDWVMPSADGLEICRRVRSVGLPHYIYIILLTSKTDSSDLVAGLEAGADDYVSKPVDFNELKLRLRAGFRVIESEERHRMVAETASDGIVTMEGDDRIQFANHAAGRIFGWQPAELIGSQFSKLAPGFDRSLRDASTARAASEISERLRSWNPVEIMGVQRSGREIVLEVSFSESQYGGHERVLTAMIRDITERRRLEGQRAQAQKLESIGQLAAGVAHEINTPIQYIGDNLRFIQESYSTLSGALSAYRKMGSEMDPAAMSALEAVSNDPAIDFEFLEREMPCAIEQALEGVQHVAEIVRAMKEFSHPGPVEMCAADLNHLIQTTVVVSRNQWKYVADLNTDLDPGLPFVACLAGELSQVFLNLIVNAADAIGDARKLKPGTKGVIAITTRCVDGQAEVRVSDTGTGIPPEIRSKIFDPFFTTKDIGRGSGQGLALAYATMKKHHGTIEFETAMGVGTTFILRVPTGVPEEWELGEAEQVAAGEMD